MNDPTMNGRARPRQMHGNSLSAYWTGHHEMEARCRQVIEELRRGGPGTDHELAERIGLHHRQNVAPRITTLIRMGALVEEGRRKDAVTGKTCRVVGLAPVHAGKQWRGWDGWQDQETKQPTLGI